MIGKSEDKEVKGKGFEQQGWDWHQGTENTSRKFLEIKRKALDIPEWLGWELTLFHSDVKKMLFKLWALELHLCLKHKRWAPVSPNRKPIWALVSPIKLEDGWQPGSLPFKGSVIFLETLLHIYLPPSHIQDQTISQQPTNKHSSNPHNDQIL